jgi:hypothetical protein
VGSKGVSEGKVKIAVRVGLGVGKVKGVGGATPGSVHAPASNASARIPKAVPMHLHFTVRSSGRRALERL